MSRVGFVFPSKLGPSHGVMKWTRTTILLFLLLALLAFTVVKTKPTEMKRGKRQSDQRIAELETLLALQKYGQHRLREWGRGRDLAPPGYGIIDFDKIGRKKKSTRYSAGDEGLRSRGGWLVEVDRQGQFEPPSGPVEDDGPVRDN